MKKGTIFLIIAWVVILFGSCQNVYAGTVYTLTQNSGTLTLTQTMESHTFLSGDTVKLAANGVYDLVQAQTLNGSTGNNIVVLGNGSRSTQSSFQQPVWSNVSFVKFVNLLDSNWFGKHTFSFTVHDVTFDHCQASNNSSQYNTQPYWQWDNPAITTMVFTGSKLQTFYNITVSHCRFEGFTSIGGAVLTIGSGWGSGTEPKRSIALDWLFDTDTIQNIYNTQIGSSGTGQTVDGIFGTGWGIEIKNCKFLRILPVVGAYQNSHTAAITWYGSVKVHNNRQDSCYAQMARVTPSGWSGLPGYVGNGTASYQYNNIIHNQYSYSAFEVNQNNLANRTPTNGVYPTRDTCVQNTVHRTPRHSYNGNYYGYICDNVNQDTLYCGYNYIMNPEWDFPYRPDLRDKYSVAQVSMPDPDSTNVGNLPFQTWVSTIVEDTIGYLPTIGGPLSNLGHVFSFRKYDYNGDSIVTTTPDVGAVQTNVYIIPGCSTNLLPVNGDTLASPTSAVLTWQAVFGANTFDVYLNGAFVTNVSTTTYTATTLPQMNYLWYVVPRSPLGPAVGCSVTNTGFVSGKTVVSDWPTWLIFRQ